jgi:hypothetical protein
MSNDARTSQAPRTPTPDELQQLADCLVSIGYDPNDAISIAGCAYVAVYDDYCTGGPGYFGKLMSVVWDAAPSFFDVFTWKNWKMERSGRDYDEKECDRCGAKNGTLCVNCWRQERP